MIAGREIISEKYLIYNDKVVFYQVFIQPPKIIIEDIGYPTKELKNQIVKKQTEYSTTHDSYTITLWVAKGM